MQPSHRATAVLCLALLPLRASADEWPSFRGDGTGRAVGVLPDGEGPTAMQLRWKRPLGPGYSGIAAAEGALVTALGDGENDVVVALDPESGAERWRQVLGPAYPGNDGSHAGPVSTPAVAGGRVFALGPRGHLAAFDLASGKSLWRRHLVDELGSEKPVYGFGSSPLVVGESVVLTIGGADGALAAFDAATGALRWRSFVDEIFAQSPVLAELAGRRQVLALGEKSLAGLDPETGEILWTFEHGGSPDGAMGSATSSPMPIGDDRILVKHQDDSSLIVRVATGAEGWKAERVHEATGLNRSYSPPTLWEHRAYGYTARFLSALDLDSGALLWRSREPGDGFLVAADGLLAVLTKEGSLHLGQATPEGWVESARLDLFDELAWTPPSICGGSLCVRSQGEIARVDLVRAPTAADPVQSVELPRALAPLAREIAGGARPSEAVARFLEGRERPLVDADEVVFVWNGSANDVAIAGDMIGIRREERMHRLEGTDLWWWTTRLDPHARTSYLFLVDDVPTPDPGQPRRTASTMIGADMNWLRGEPIERSWMAMPQWPGSQLPSDLPPAPVRGRVEEMSLQVRPEGEDAEPVEVQLDVWLPPGYDTGAERYPVVFVHNPQVRELGGWTETLDRVVGHSVAPLVVAFVEAPRMRGYAGAFAQQIAPAIDARFRTRGEREHRANVGMGFQGLPALLVGLGERQSFGRLGLQSVLALDQGLAAAEALLAPDPAAEQPALDVYVEWGRWDLVSPHEEMDMRETGAAIQALLEKTGAKVVGGEVWDSADVGSWRNRTDVMLETLFPLGTPDPARLAHWLTAGP